jgi:hypothetical protein
MVAHYTVFKKMENSRFRCVFLDNYYLLLYKKYLTYIKQHLESLADILIGFNVVSELMLCTELKFTCLQDLHVCGENHFYFLGFYFMKLSVKVIAAERASLKRASVAAT